jgi:hypothetical protein
MFKDRASLAPRLRGKVTKIRYNKQKFPVTDHLAENTLWFNTNVLMGDRSDAKSVLEAIGKIANNAQAVAKLDAPQW